MTALGTCAVANAASNFFEPDTQRCSTDRTYKLQVSSFSVKKAANSTAGRDYNYDFITIYRYTRYYSSTAIFFFNIVSRYIYYASVGGATRHTVVRLSLCLGGRSHEAYCNRVVCLSVVLSVCYTTFAAHAGRYALKLAMQVEIDIISVVN